MRTRQTLIALALAVACATGTQAECLNDAQVADLTARYLARTPAPNPEKLSEAEATCTRAKFNAQLEKHLGKVIGYKAALTNPAVQQRFGTTQPVWGKLYEGMVLPNGATVEAAFGARPLFEADMLVRVRSSAVNQAKTPMEVLQAIDQGSHSSSCPICSCKRRRGSTARAWRRSTPARAWAWPAHRCPCPPTAPSATRCSTPCVIWM